MARESRTPDEFSRPVSVRDIPADGIVRRLEATPDECAAIARRLGVLAVGALTAELEIRRWRRDGLSVTGSFTGRVEQTSVVSLEPVGAELSEEIALRLLPEGGRHAGSDTGPRGRRRRHGGRPARDLHW